jgi:hypothetical protein
MIPYFLLLVVPSLFALFNTRRLSLILWYMAFVIFVLFVGLRYEVGPDWQQYRYIHQSLAYFSFWDVIGQVEPLSYLLFWISQTSGNDVYLSNMVAAFILMAGVFSFARLTANPWLAVVSATPYLIIVMGMSGVRQTMAAGIILFLFSRWDRYSFLRRGLYILIAAMFHTSALINNIFLIIKLNISLKYKLLFGIVISVLTLYVGTEVPLYADNVIKYQQRYLEGSFIERSLGSIYHIAMIAIPAIVGLIYKKRIIDSIHNPALLRFGLYAAITVLVLSAFSSTVASRLTVYLYFVPMMVYPALVTTLGRRGEIAGILGIIIFHMLILLGWFMFGNHAYAYMPYNNIMFDDYIIDQRIIFDPFQKK